VIAERFVALCNGNVKIKFLSLHNATGVGLVGATGLPGQPGTFFYILQHFVTFKQYYYRMFWLAYCINSLRVNLQYASFLSSFLSAILCVIRKKLVEKY